MSGDSPTAPGISSPSYHAEKPSSLPSVRLSHSVSAAAGSETAVISRARAVFRPMPISGAAADAAFVPLVIPGASAEAARDEVERRLGRFAT